MATEAQSSLDQRRGDDNMDTESALFQSVRQDSDSGRGALATPSVIDDEMEKTAALLKSKDDETKIRSNNNMNGLTTEEQESGPSETARNSSCDETCLSMPNIGTNNTTTTDSLVSPILKVRANSSSRGGDESGVSLQDNSSSALQIQVSDQTDTKKDQLHVSNNSASSKEYSNHVEALVSSDTLLSLPESNGRQEHSFGKDETVPSKDQLIIRKTTTKLIDNKNDDAAADSSPRTLLTNKSNDTLLSLPEIGTNTTTDTVLSSSPDDELEENDNDETDSRDAATTARPQQQDHQFASTTKTETTSGNIYGYFVQHEKSTNSVSTTSDCDDDDDGNDYHTTDCGGGDGGGGDTEALTIPEIGTDTTYSTEDDDDDDDDDYSTGSKPLLQNLSEEALFLYENDNLLRGSHWRQPDETNNIRYYRRDPVMLEQIMPRQPGGMLTSQDAKVEEEEEKIEVHDEYDHNNSHRSEPEEVLDINSSPPPEPVVVEETHLSEAFVLKNSRPEYVSATVLKVEAEYEHGLEFVSIDGVLRISSISSTGLFWDSPLKPFDRVLRINNLNCETLDPVNASHLLDVLTGFVIVIAHNMGGDSSLIESQIAKPRPDSELGISFKDICRDAVLRKNEVEITRVGDKSLFTGSLLHVGDRVLSVNQSVDIDSNLIDIMLSTSPRHVTILAQTKLKTQMAIARRPTHQLPPGYNIVRATAEARRQRAELRRKQGCYYNMCERPGACANFFQWVGNVYVITIVIVGVVISWETVKEQTYDGSDTVGTILKFMGLFVGGILLGFLVNAPWWFRKVGARFSVAQLVCNAIVIASFFILTRFFDSADLVQDYRLVIFFAIFFPLLIIVNLPTIFVRTEDGSDGNTISDRSRDDDDNMSSNSSMTSHNV